MACWILVDCDAGACQLGSRAKASGQNVCTQGSTAKTALNTSGEHELSEREKVKPTSSGRLSRQALLASYAGIAILSLLSRSILVSLSGSLALFLQSPSHSLSLSLSLSLSEIECQTTKIHWRSVLELTSDGPTGCNNATD